MPLTKSKSEKAFKQLMPNKKYGFYNSKSKNINNDLNNFYNNLLYSFIITIIVFCIYLLFYHLVFKKINFTLFSAKPKLRVKHPF